MKLGEKTIKITKKDYRMDDMMIKALTRKQMNKQKKDNQQKTTENNETKKPTNEWNKEQMYIYAFSRCFYPKRLTVLYITFL